MKVRTLKVLAGPEGVTLENVILDLDSKEAKLLESVGAVEIVVDEERVEVADATPGQDAKKAALARAKKAVKAK